MGSFILLQMKPSLLLKEPSSNKWIPRFLVVEGNVISCENYSLTTIRYVGDFNKENCTISTGLNTAYIPF